MLIRRFKLFVVFVITLIPFATITAQGSSVFNGAITDAEYYYVIDLPTIAEGSSITVDARAVSGDLDAVIVLYYENGIYAAESDDRAPGNPNPFLTYENAPAGNYRVLISRYGLEQGDTSGDFAATVDIKQGGGAILSTVTPETLIDWEAAGYPNNTPAPMAKWTILAYYDADNNLESGIMYDMDEFERGGGSTESVRILTLLDRAVDFDTSNGNWTDARVYEVGADKSNDVITTYPPTLDSDPLAYLGEIDMGDEVNLLNFLVWGMTMYPAERYAISLNNHGGAWAGTAWDDSSSVHNNLTVPEMAAVFNRALQEVGRSRFDLLINDSCLMSSMENFAGISPYFDYAFSSPEIMNNPGFNMTTLVETLNQRPEIEIPVLGQIVADRYMQDMNTSMPGMATYMGVGITNLREFPNLINALNAFTAVIDTKPESYTALLGRVRANTYTYSTWAGSNDSVDVGNFMGRIVSSTADSEVRAAAQNVLDTLNSALVYSTAGDLLAQETSFYNIFFPQGSENFNPRYLQQSPLAGWRDMLRAYFSSLNSEDGSFGFDVLNTAPQVNIANLFPSITSIQAPVTISMEVVGNNISHGDFTVDQIQADGSLVRLTQRRIVTENVLSDGRVEYINFWHPGVDDFDFTWSTQIPFVSDGSSENPEMVVSAGEVSSLSGIYQYPGNNQTIDVDVIFDNSGAFSTMIARQRDTSGFATIRPEVGGIFQAYRSSVSTSGESVTEMGNTYVWPEAGLTWVNHPAPTGRYNLGFLVQGFDGSIGFNSTAVSVNHDGLDLSLQGYVDDEWGFILRYPADWSGIIYYPDQGWESANDPTGRQYTYIYPVSPSSTDPVVIAQEAMAQYGVDVNLASLQPIAVSGRAGVSFTYEWATGSTVFSGHAFAYYEPSLELGFVIAAETTDGSDPTPIFEILRNGITFFDPVELSSHDAGKWTYDTHNDDASFPILEDWSPGYTADDWSIYYEDGIQGRGTYIAITERPATSTSDILGDLMVEYFGNDPTIQTERQNTYYGEENTWDYVIFHGQDENGTPITGGIYATMKNGNAYVVWFQAPDSAISQLANAFFVSIDGFTIE